MYLSLKRLTGQPHYNGCGFWLLLALTAVKIASQQQGGRPLNDFIWTEFFLLFFGKGLRDFLLITTMLLKYITNPTNTNEFIFKCIKPGDLNKNFQQNQIVCRIFNHHFFGTYLLPQLLDFFLRLKTVISMSMKDMNLQ